MKNEARVGWVAHAGLGRHLPGGTPTAATVRRALDLGVDAIELDVCVTADRVLVLRHDTTAAPRVPVATMQFSILRHLYPDTLTLAEGMELIGRGTNILLDVKTPETAQVLSREFALRPPPENVAVCTEVTQALLILRRRAPLVPRWLAIPNIGGSAGMGARVVVDTMLDRRSRGMLASVVGGFSRAAIAVARDPVRALAHLGGIPWRSWLAEEIVALAAAVDASGVCLHHWLVDSETVAACHASGLPVAAYTVNRATDTERAVAAGVDLITTDSVEPMRRVIERRPARAALPRYRAATR